MCNRYTPGEREAIMNHFAATSDTAYNADSDRVHPKDFGPVLRLVEGAIVLKRMTWGIPVVLKGKKGQPLAPKAVNNARFDKLGAFWKRWAVEPKHRCLIPTSRFAEAVGPKGKMTETWLSLTDQPIFAWAGSGQMRVRDAPTRGS